MENAELRSENWEGRIEKGEWGIGPSTHPDKAGLARGSSLRYENQ